MMTGMKDAHLMKLEHIARNEELLRDTAKN